MNADERQVGGSHYRDTANQNGIQQHWNRMWLQYREAWFVGNITKYVERYRSKNGLQDLEKARHYLDKLIELETAAAEAELRKQVDPLAVSPSQPDQRDRGEDTARTTRDYPDGEDRTNEVAARTPRRTRAQVLAAQRTMIGCCNRYADDMTCDCLEKALDDRHPSWDDPNTPPGDRSGS